MDEAVDVYKWGDLVASLLTGMEPVMGTRKQQLHYTPHSMSSNVRHNNPTEQRLAELVNQTWALDPADRPDIFQVVRILREMKQQQLGAAAEKG